MDEDKEREHPVILRKRGEVIIGAKCGFCAYELGKPDAYHPKWYCILVREKVDPEKAVRAAANKLGKGKQGFVGDSRVKEVKVGNVGVDRSLVSN